MPRLLPEDEVYMEAFHVLNSARTYNMGGPNPIALSEMLAYVRDLTLFETLESRRLFVRFLQGLDEVMLSESAKKTEQRLREQKPPA